MSASPEPLREWRDVTPALFRAEIVPLYQPAVLRGLAASWPAVAHARRSTAELVAYLTGFDRGAIVEAFVGPPAIEGRYFYAEDMRGFNFERRQGPFGEVLRHVESIAGRAGAPSVYVGASALTDCAPGLAGEMPMPLLAGTDAVPRVWFGTASQVSTHFDQSDNIACVVAGRRRFTLFPPEQVANIYVGPLDHNMAGQPASMVSLRDPDLARYPRFAEALAAARCAELEPGDAIYIPALWWHNIEALSPFNLLVNYWWDDAPADAGAPFEAMVHGLFAISTLPPARRAAWRALFDQYVFRPEGEDPAAHLAPAARGILGASTPELRERIRHFLLRGLGRR